MKLKPISVIIPACNEAGHIAETMLSYFVGNSPLEIIVVANGCSDDTANIAEDLGAKVIEEEEGNVSLARNKGAKEAEGDILVFNDADTTVAPNYLEEVNAAISRGYQYGCARCRADERRLPAIFYAFALNVCGRIFRETGGNLFITRDLFDETINGFNPDLKVGEDTDLNMRLKKIGGRYKFLSSTHISPSSRRIKSSWQVLRGFGFSYLSHKLL